jgi:proteasome activator subunit 4
MSELNDNTDLRTYSTAVLYVLSAVNPPPDYLKVIITRFVDVIKSSTVR